MTRWLLKQSSANIEELARRTGLSPVLARLFAVRGYRDPAAVNRFLQAQLQDLADPLLFRDMDRAVAAVAEAVRNQISCAVFGDYDADGVMSTVIMLSMLRSLGLDARYYIPSREHEGYGMRNEAIAFLAAQGVKLLLACDNGITALEQVDYAHSLGMEVVIFDHHELAVDPETGGQLLPGARAVVNAKRRDCGYPFKNYCAAALCYRFAQALCTALGKDWGQFERDLLPFAAIATVCDIVELTGDNRVLVKAGLPALGGSANPGLNALLKAVELDKTPLDTFHVGFILGPCINASGRLNTADNAVELFMARDCKAADVLAARLVEMNKQRRDVTEAGTSAAFRIVEEQQLYQDKVLVVYCREIPDSVAGIIAGRLKEKYHRPAIAIGGNEEKGLLRGSCRSIEGYNIVEALIACQDLLHAFGGHPLAAGLTIAFANIPGFRSRINSNCQLTEEELQPLYRIDCALPLPQADLKLARQLEVLAPFGKGNEQPCFADKRLKLERLSVLGKNEQVLRWHLRHASGPMLEAVDFQHKERLRGYLTTTYGETVWRQLCQGCCPETICLDIIYTVKLSAYNGQERAQLRIVDFRGS